MKVVQSISHVASLKRGVYLRRGYYYHLPSPPNNKPETSLRLLHSSKPFHTGFPQLQKAAVAMDFCVDKNNLDKCAWEASPPLLVHEGEVLLKINKFSFTANNISYGATGDALKYWEFFPTLDQDKGRIPVWGVATIVASRCSGLQEGRKVYGYFSMSHYVVTQPIHVNHADFIDGLPHRRGLPALYNQYFLCDEDPFYTPRIEDAMMVLRPLFLTSWLLVDFFTHPTSQQGGAPFFGSQSIILSSASSKTSI